MKFDPTTRAAIVGCGDMARASVRGILADFQNTRIEVVCEPSAESYRQTAEIFQAAGREAPANVPDLERMLDAWAGSLDAVYIATPHVLHFSQARACLEAGLDVLVEKPMVMNSGEARDLIETRDRTGRLLVVAFQGSLSPQVRRAVEMLRSGELGPVRSISGMLWQNWGGMFAEAWRSRPEISGGGFLFDTGAHMLNTVCDLAGEDFAVISAILDNKGGPVEVNAVIMGRLRSGALVTINACGDTTRSCASDVRVFCSEAVLRTTVWGDSLEIMQGQPQDWRLTGSSREEGWEPVDVRETRGVWEEFLSAREGLIANPSPPELGLRMALIWDAIRQSAEQDGSPVRM